MHLTFNIHIMKDSIRFYRNCIIFHLIAYPLVTWFLVFISNDRITQTFLIWVFAIGMLTSILFTSVLPLIKLYKQEKINQSKRLMKEDVL